MEVRFSKTVLCFALMSDPEGNVTFGRLVIGSEDRDLRSWWHPLTRRLEAWCLEGCGQRPGETAVVFTSRKQTSGPAIAAKRRDSEEKTGFASRNASATQFFFCCFFLHASQADCKTFFRLTVSYFQRSCLFFFFPFFWEEVVERHNLYFSLLRSSLRNVVARRL